MRRLIFIVMFLGAVLPVGAQTVVTGCTGPATEMVCNWAIDTKAMGPGKHTLEFTITEANGVKVTHKIILNVSAVSVSDVTNTTTALSFKISTPIGVQSIDNVTLDGQPFTVTPAP